MLAFLHFTLSSSALASPLKASAVGVPCCKQAGLPTSQASRMLCTNGICPKKGISNCSESPLAPSLPKM